LVIQTNYTHIIGFTGTRNGMTPRQLATFTSEFAKEAGDPFFERFIHGGAEGADEEAHMQASGFIRPQKITILPANQKRYRFWKDLYREMGLTSPPVIAEPKPPLARNKDIVAMSRILIACPAQDEVIRSGTWATVRYTRKKNIPRILIYPDGSIIREDP
jgi:predicted Rossmann fold nucleotide-binding protein DprA/Smf involved in DNA uptake